MHRLSRQTRPLALPGSVLASILVHWTCPERAARFVETLAVCKATCGPTVAQVCVGRRLSKYGTCRNGGGLVDATGGWLVGAKGEYPVCTSNLPKVYQYLAAGKPVVATRLPALIPFGEATACAAGADEFVGAIEAALASAGDPGTQRERQQYVRQFDWPIVGRPGWACSPVPSAAPSSESVLRWPDFSSATLLFPAVAWLHARPSVGIRPVCLLPLPARNCAGSLGQRNGRRALQGEMTHESRSIQ
jgi:hypothetical protein